MRHLKNYFNFPAFSKLNKLFFSLEILDSNHCAFVISPSLHAKWANYADEFIHFVPLQVSRCVIKSSIVGLLWWFQLPILPVVHLNFKNIILLDSSNFVFPCSFIQTGFYPCWSLAASSSCPISKAPSNCKMTSSWMGCYLSKM